MGVVYVGRHETLGHRVVVKVLQPELSRNADMVQRFFNEAQATTAIRNPGIVQVFDFGTTPDGRAYFVMELREGQTLAARLKQQRHDYEECCRLGRQIANVLQAAHAAGITHRDLKPDNLFLVPDLEVIGGERVKVLDFGIAKLAGEARSSGVKTHTGLMMGTPHYMSPEQCRSASTADPRSDIYSLGCILFEMACRRPPFIGGGLGDIVAAHLHEPPPRPQNFAPDIPGGLSALIVNMLAKHPDARPQTMTLVSQMLDEVLRTFGGSSVRAPTPLPMPPPPPPPPRAPTPFPAPEHAPSPFPVASSTPPSTRAPAPFPVPQLSPTSTTLSGSASTFGVQPRAGARRIPVLLGGIVVVLVGAVAAIAIVLATKAPGSPGRLISYDKIVVAPRVADATAGAEGAAVAQPLAPHPAPIVGDAAAEAARPMTAGDLEAECRKYSVDRKWDALAPCADKLKPLDPKRAAELRTRAVEEARSVPRIAGVEAALHDKNLKRAKAELDQVWAESVEYPKIKRTYEIAEVQATDDLAAQLDHVKSSSCEAYNQLLAKARAANPPRVTAEAARRIPCAAPPTCNADALSEKALEQYRVNQLAESLAFFEAAYTCKPSPSLLQRAFVIACNLRNVAKARSYWKRLSLAMRTQALSTCMRNDITETMLNAP